jgi:hypothetical protein
MRKGRIGHAQNPVTSVHLRRPSRDWGTGSFNSAKRKTFFAVIPNDAVGTRRVVVCQRA